MTPRGHFGGVDAPPRWFDLLALAGVLGMALVGTFGLLLAVLGVYRTWLALLLGVPCTVVALLGVRRVLPPGPSASISTVRGVAAIAAVVVAGGYLVFAGSYPSQNVIATRDPGVYMNTARWLSRDGDLDAPAERPAFTGVEGLRFDSAGVYDMGDGEVEFQFNHLSSVLMSVGHDLGGYRALFRVPALASAIGLLALYAVAVRVTRRPVISLIAPVLLAGCMPLLFASRNTYSEPFAFALLWGAVLALADLHRRPRLTMAITGGIALGALASTRIDALMYVALLFPLAALSLMTGEAPARRRRALAWVAAIVATAAVGAVGFVDLFVWTGDYASHLGSQVRLLWVALAGSVAVSAAALVVWRYLPGLRRLLERLRNPLALVGGGLVLAVLLAGWLVRPLVQTVRGGYAYEAVQNIQRFEGLEPDPTRTYAEDSLHWMAWYLGPVSLAAAILGLAYVVHRSIRGRATPAATGAAVLTLAAGALYWWDPSITPDQLFASRRFVPAILPGLAVMAVAPVAALWQLDRLWQLRWAARGGPWLRRGAVAVLALAMIVPAAATTWPLRWQRTQYGFLNPVLEACELMPEDAAVVVLGGYAGATLSQTLRSWCGVPVAAQGDGVDADNVDEVAEQVERNGFTLTLVSADSRDLTTFLDVAGNEPEATNSAADHWLVQPTLDRPPNSYVEYERTSPVEIPFRLHLLVVDGA